MFFPLRLGKCHLILQAQALEATSSMGEHAQELGFLNGVHVHSFLWTTWGLEPLYQDLGARLVDETFASTGRCFPTRHDGKNQGLVSSLVCTFRAGSSEETLSTGVGMEKAHDYSLHGTWLGIFLAGIGSTSVISCFCCATQWTTL